MIHRQHPHQHFLPHSINPPNVVHPHPFHDEVHYLREENAKLIKTLKNRDVQIDELMKKQSPDIEGLEKLRQEQARHEAELLYEIESLRAQLQERELPVANTNHHKQLVETQSKILYFGEQIQQNERVIQMKNEEIKMLMGRLAEMDHKKDSQDKIHEADQRIHTILDKLEKVTHRLHHKHEECDQYKHLLTVREAEISEWKVKSSQTDQLGVQLKGLEQRTTLLALENDRLTQLLNHRNNDITYLKGQLNERNDKWTSQEERIGYLQGELNSKLINPTSTSEIDQLKIQLRQKVDEVESLRKQAHYQGPVIDSEKVYILQDEINRLNKIVIEQRLELETQRTKISDENWMNSRFMDQQRQIERISEKKSVRYL